MQVHASKKIIDKLESMTLPRFEKERCALIFGREEKDLLHISSVVEVRNIKRMPDSFGISKRDIEQWRNKGLFGIFHTHRREEGLSAKDLMLFNTNDYLQIQIIGLADPADMRAKFFCYHRNDQTTIKIQTNK